MNILLKKNNTGLSDELIEQIVKIILEHALAGKIIIYGSRARGDFKRTSDIDIAVECYDVDGKTGILNEILNDQLPTLLKCEIVNFKKVAATLKKEIVEEGLVLYEKV